ncbi:hypothetical protein, partial [Hungatella sp.]|uniref:hypothetical protein n=1 Tax=Hungatella sp. TaxID=2613924 RepID=UPI002A7F66C3
ITQKQIVLFVALSLYEIRIFKCINVTAGGAHCSSCCSFIGTITQQMIDFFTAILQEINAHTSCSK